MYILGLLQGFFMVKVLRFFKEIGVYPKRLDPDPVQIFRIRPVQQVPDLTGAGYIALH
jgi:hypothetical protein